MRTLLACALLALPCAAQTFPSDYAEPLHPSACSRPIVTATRTDLPGGTILQTFEIVDMPSIDGHALPELKATSAAAAATQAILVDGWGPLGDRSAYKVFVDWDWVDFQDSYGAENLSATPFGSLTGYSYTIPYLLIGDPVPWNRGGSGWSIFGVSLSRAWDLGSLDAWDGQFLPDPWTGPSGSTTGQVDQTNPTADDQETTYWLAKEYMASRARFLIYFTPSLWSNFDGWPLGIRCDEDGKPLVKGQEVGQGHGGIWPWFHQWRNERYRFTLRYEPQ